MYTHFLHEPTTMPTTANELGPTEYSTDHISILYTLRSMPTRKHSYLHTYKLKNESVLGYSKSEQIFSDYTWRLYYQCLHASEICFVVTIWVRFLLVHRIIIYWQRYNYCNSVAVNLTF